VGSAVHDFRFLFVAQNLYIPLELQKVIQLLYK